LLFLKCFLFSPMILTLVYGMLLKKVNTWWVIEKCNFSYYSSGFFSIFC
jgi:hypothetical protein